MATAILMEAAEEAAGKLTMIGHVPMRDPEEAIKEAITEETTGMKETIIALIEEEITRTEEVAAIESIEGKADVTSTDLILKTLKSPPHLSEIEETETKGALTTALHPNPTRKRRSRKRTPLKSKSHLRKLRSPTKSKRLRSPIKRRSLRSHRL